MCAALCGLAALRPLTMIMLGASPGPHPGSSTGPRLRLEGQELRCPVRAGRGKSASASTSGVQEVQLAPQHPPQRRQLPVPHAPLEVVLCWS
jgi:hypothetical protein